MIWLKGKLLKMNQVKEWFDLSKTEGPPKKKVRGRFKIILKKKWNKWQHGLGRIKWKKEVALYM